MDRSKTLDQWSANHGSVPTTRFIVSLIRTFDFLPIIDSVGGKDFTTPLWIASKQGHYEVLKLLHQAGANINAKDIYGNTPLHMASKYGHHKVSTRLLLIIIQRGWKEPDRKESDKNLPADDIG